MEFFDNLEPLLRILWFIAIPTSLIFLIQTIMTFAGIDASDGIEADFDSDLGHGDTPFQVLSFRNLTNFLLGLSWTGISFYEVITNKIVLISLAFVVGAGFVAGFFFIMRQIQRLSEDNSFKISNTLDKVCSVYLTIPGKKSGKGKVQVSVNGSFHELDAITESDKIESGTTVRISRIENNNLVVVERV